LPVGNGGTGLTSLTQGYIPYGTGTTAFGSTSNLFWDSANNRLGIGTASPGTKFSIGAGGNDLGMFLGRGAVTNFFEAYDNTKSFIAGVDASNSFAKVGTLSAHDLAIITANGAKIYIQNSTGYVGIGTDTASPACILDISGTTGGQIKFPATQNASSDANTLDDYEEGTWTAAFVAGGGTITIDNSYKTGAYTKIGRQVTLTGYFIVGSVSSPSGNVSISGLPFTASGASDAFNTSGGLYLIQTNPFTGYPFINKQAGTSTFLIQYTDTLGNINAAASLFKAGTEVKILISYFT
jgi:hypothetical protein